MDLLNNIEKIHTTELGIERISKNLQITEEVVEYCKRIISNENSFIARQGKNWYVHNEDIILTINASNYCIITAHKK